MSKSKELQKFETQDHFTDFVQHINSFLHEKGIKLQLKTLTLDVRGSKPCTRNCGKNKHCVWTITDTGDFVMDCKDN